MTSSSARCPGGGWAPPGAAGRGAAAVLRRGVCVLSWVSGAGVVFMMSITCLDIVLRLFRRPLRGSYDLISIGCAVSMACALPYLTALKGHVAIEYFFHKLDRGGRIAVDTLVRVMGVVLFALLTRESVRIGATLRTTAEVSPSLQIPLFWIPWVIALCCALTMLVILYHLAYPGRQLVQP